MRSEALIGAALLHFSVQSALCTQKFRVNRNQLDLDPKPQIHFYFVSQEISLAKPNFHSGRHDSMDHFPRLFAFSRPLGQNRIAAAHQSVNNDSVFQAKEFAVLNHPRQQQTRRFSRNYQEFSLKYYAIR
jgi:hypothetical protein